MALVLKDRVQQTGTANTTVSFTLSGSVTGYQSFSVVGDTNTTYYAATDASGNWEAGLGTYSTTGPTLTRTTILSSSNSGSAVTFSGTVNVFLTYPSSRALYLDGTSANINVSQAAFTANGIPYASSTTALATGSALTFDGSYLATTVRAKATAFQFAGTSTTIPNPNAGFGYNSTSTNITAYTLGNSYVGINGYGINISATDAFPIAKLTISGAGALATSWFTAPTATNAFGIYYSGGSTNAGSGPYGAIDGANAVSFRITNLDFGDSIDSTTITNAATLYIEGAPTAGSIYTTINNSYALQVATGTSYFGGSVTLASGGSFSGTITGSPTFSGGITISNGGTLTGTFAGTHTYSGATTQSGGATFSNTAGTKITLSGNVSRTSWALTGPAINVAATTFTSSNVLTGVVGINTLNVPTIVSTGTGTATDVANLYVAAPALSTNMSANTTNRWAIYTPFNANGDVYVGGTRLWIYGNSGTIPAASFNAGFGCGFVVNGATYKSAAGLSAGGNIAVHSIGRPTIDATTAGQTVGELYTLYLENSPNTAAGVSGTSQPYYNLYVAAGTSYFKGNVVCASPCTSVANSNAALCKLQITGSATVSLNSVAGVGIRVDASTYTDSNSSTVAATAIHAIAAPTITNDTAAITYTNVSTLYIAAAPIASASGGFSPTFTNAYSLYIAAGASYFGGAITCNSNLRLAAGTTALAPIDFTAGSLLTSPVEGAMEFDGTAFYTTDDVTDGRGYLASIHYFRLAADVTAFGPAIGNFFGATSGMNLDAGVYYEVEAYLYFTKTTAGTVTFTMTFSNGPANNDAHYVGTPVGGIGTVGSAVTAAIAKSTATAGALPVTGTLTTAVNHQYTLRSMFLSNATTGGTFNIQITSSAGTVTPLTGSYYKLTRLPAANTGAFV